MKNRIFVSAFFGKPSQILALMLFLCAIAASSRADAQYTQNNLVSDVPGVAAVQDPNLVNPWGLASSSRSPIWASDNGTGLATLYTGAGVTQGLVVTIPPPTGTSAPTGVVFNPTTGFGGSPFIFATENGTIAAWPGNSTTAVQEFPTTGSPTGVYKGLAINTTANLLYATNFRAGTVDVFNSNFSQVSLSGTFTDPNLPAGYAPFGINNIGGKIYVTYAVQDAAKFDDVAGPGNGIIDVYDASGNFLGRLASGGVLNSPWGLALAPGNFGIFSNDLLVGNFGDGTINAFDITTGQFLGELKDAQGNPIVNPGLWGLLFGNGGAGGATNELFFSAGIFNEDRGLFGDITVAVASVPEPATWAMMLIGFAGLGFAFRHSRHKVVVCLNRSISRWGRDRRFLAVFSFSAGCRLSARVADSGCLCRVHITNFVATSKQIGEGGQETPDAMVVLVHQSDLSSP